MDTVLCIADATSFTSLDLAQHYTLIQSQHGARNAIEMQFQTLPARVSKFVPKMTYKKQNTAEA